MSREEPDYSSLGLQQLFDLATQEGGLAATGAVFKLVLLHIGSQEQGLYEKWEVFRDVDLSPVLVAYHPSGYDTSKPESVWLILVCCDMRPQDKMFWLAYTNLIRALDEAGCRPREIGLHIRRSPEELKAFAEDMLRGRDQYGAHEGEYEEVTDVEIIEEGGGDHKHLPPSTFSDSD